MKSKLKSYWRPTPTKYRKIGDAILIGCTGLSSAFMGAPMSDTAKMWVVFALNMGGVAGKIITNFFTDEQPAAPPVEPPVV